MPRDFSQEPRVRHRPELRKAAAQNLDNPESINPLRTNTGRCSLPRVWRISLRSLRAACIVKANEGLIPSGGSACAAGRGGSSPSSPAMSSSQIP
jgi:cysteine sulfinate desulfinase/cysteine desulfurase-like protein